MLSVKQTRDLYYIKYIVWKSFQIKIKSQCKVIDLKTNTSKKKLKLKIKKMLMHIYSLSYFRIDIKVHEFVKIHWIISLMCAYLEHKGIVLEADKRSLSSQYVNILVSHYKNKFYEKHLDFHLKVLPRIINTRLSFLDVTYIFSYCSSPTTGRDLLFSLLSPIICPVYSKS